MTDFLSQRAIVNFLPLVPKTRQWKDRRKVIMWPLFTSYVFVRFPWRDLNAILSTPGVSAVVRTHGEPAPIADDEVENVRRFVGAVTAAGLEPETAALVAGQSVRITDGPLRGVVGVVINRRGRHRVLVSVGAIGCGVEVDIGDLMPETVATSIPHGRMARHA